MYLMHNNEKYEIHKRNVFLDIDEYNEIYFVYSGEYEFYTLLCINKEKKCRIQVAYYYAIINKTIKIIDDEIFVPIRKFISDRVNYTTMESDIISLSFWNNYEQFPLNIRKITTYVLIYGSNLYEYLETIYLFHNNAKQYIINDSIFLIIESDESDLDNLRQEIARCKFTEIYDIDVYHYIEKIDLSNQTNIF